MLNAGTRSSRLKASPTTSTISVTGRMSLTRPDHTGTDVYWLFKYPRNWNPLGSLWTTMLRNNSKRHRDSCSPIQLAWSATGGDHVAMIVHQCRSISLKPHAIFVLWSYINRLTWLKHQAGAIISFRTPRQYQKQNIRPCLGSQRMHMHSLIL